MGIPKELYFFSGSFGVAAALCQRRDDVATNRKSAWEAVASSGVRKASLKFPVPLI